MLGHELRRLKLDLKKAQVRSSFFAAHEGVASTQDLTINLYESRRCSGGM